MKNIVLGRRGEHLAMAKLYEEGFLPTKGEAGIEVFDILVKYPKTDNLRQLQVKATTRKSGKPTNSSRLWKGKIYHWVMGEKHERIKGPNLFYCFVLMLKKELPRFFIVPSEDVAEYVAWENQYYRENHRSKPYEGRAFRLYVEAYDKEMKCLMAKDYENKWEFLK